MKAHSIVAPDLNDTSVRIMEALFDRPASQVSDLMVELDRSEAAIQRALRPLLMSGVVVRDLATRTYCLSAASPIARFEANLISTARARGLTRAEAVFHAITEFSQDHVVDPSDKSVFDVTAIAPHPFAEALAS